MRRKTRTVTIGNIAIGSDHPVAIQSMTNTLTQDVPSTLRQIAALEEAGCEICRVTLNDREAIAAIGALKAGTNMPLVGDIHFDYRLAIAAIEGGIDKLRINPGNIGSDDRVRAIVDAAQAHNVPLRIGVNGGSVDRDLLAKCDYDVARAMVETAIAHLDLMEKWHFEPLVLSLKSSEVEATLRAHRSLAPHTAVPFHIGITEAGTRYRGTIKSAVGLGALLAEGYGDTLRVSLATDPTEEIRVGRMILESLGLRRFGPEVIACPTCGRTRIDIEAIAESVEAATAHLDLPLKIAIMGCAVNGPGEARDADIGIAGGVGEALLFKKGEIIKKVPEDQLVATLLEEIEKMRDQK